MKRDNPWKDTMVLPHVHHLAVTALYYYASYQCLAAEIEHVRGPISATATDLMDGALTRWTAAMAELARTPAETLAEVAAKARALASCVTTAHGEPVSITGDSGVAASLLKDIERLSVVAGE